MKISRFFWLLLMLVPSVAFATGQASHVIYIDGQKWMLLGCPLAELDSAHSARFYSHLPEDRSWSTANWEGFLSYWSVEDDYLVLDSVVYKMSDKNTKQSWQKVLSQAAMQEALADYCRNGKVVATWVTHTLRAAQGKLIYYEHDAWERYHETEQHLEVKEGRIVGRKFHHNRVVVDGFDITQGQIEQWDEFQKGFAIILHRHHELDTVNKVYYTLRDCTIDSLGNLTVGEVKVWGKGTQTIADVLVEEFRQYLVEKRPWKVYFINGEYFTPLKHDWSMPISLKKRNNF